ncbi:hypothetical protein TBR22_A04150 [Luteitalea sp. TBR-22]|uniref:ATP-binding protein n=1 Tax=Luteitalea sp. TBR-22 TaxID=2802971 RepID=UPI001AFC07FE|nr:ATP-binding protein [Luteitalea sp. TBR-22]BCS31215.1 hypothetical protein TBR22_A04150 [Luteitalea sp. TBR-22]
MSLRTRLGVWAGLITFVALVAAGGAVLWLQGRLGLGRVDAELTAAAGTVAGVLQSELAEGLPAPLAVREMMRELDLAREGFAIIAADDTVLGAKPAASPRLSDQVLRARRASPATMDAGPGLGSVRLLTVPPRLVGVPVRIVVWTSLAALDAERRRLELAMLLGIPLAVVFSVIGGVAIAGRTLGPLSDLAMQAGRIDGTNLSARLRLHDREDELSAVAASFNGVLDRLASAVQQQRTFMAEASHQLRTPVSVIRTTAQVTLDQPTRAEAEYREGLDVIARQADRLTRMVDDMFVLALADAAARPLQVTHLYLDELVGEVVDDCAVLARSRGVSLVSESDGEAPCSGDEHLLRQMLTNLVENALRHTPAGGHVTVALHRDGRLYHVRVTDTGQGVPDADAHRIFDRFVRLAPAGSEGGGGLGLPIARWIADAHGGSLALVGTGPHGTQFVATLPCTPPLPPAD